MLLRSESSFLSFPCPPYLLVERYTKEDGTRIHVSRCRTNKKIFPKINREKEKSSGPGSVTYYCETRVEKYRDIQNVRKNISLPSSKENSYRILFNYENVHLSQDNVFVFVKYRVSTENTCVESVEPRWPVKLTIGRLSSRQIVS